MGTSARNVFEGVITARSEGIVQTEIEITTAGGARIAAIVTTGEAAALDLAVGRAVTALVKAPWVMLVAGGAAGFPIRNRLQGTVSAIAKGDINSGVELTLPGGEVVHSVVTNEAVLELGLQTGALATAVINPSHVVIAM